MSDPLDRAVVALRDGGLVVYPTETVYGLGADALDPAAVERVYAAKRRDREDPVSMAVPDVDAADKYVHLGERERRFAERFLPGPVTLVAERGSDVPDALTAGRDRVGLRVPDHPDALALLDRFAPVTATSANVSGRPSARRVADLEDEIRESAAVVLNAGETPGGTGSTVVDVERGEVIRAGALAGEVREWLEAN